MTIETHREITHFLRAAADASEEAETEEIAILSHKWRNSLQERETSLLQARRTLAAVAEVRPVSS